MLPWAQKQIFCCSIIYIEDSQLFKLARLPRDFSDVSYNYIQHGTSEKRKDLFRMKN